MPRVIPKTDESHDRFMERVINRTAPLRIELAGTSPYSQTSTHSWVLDSASASLDVADPKAIDRLQRFAYDREDNPQKHETRAVTTTTLGGLIPATIPPFVAEAVAFGVRSTAPLAVALLRLDLPPVGMNVAWAKVTTGATVTNQAAENTAMTASADPVVASATDALGTIAAYVDFSAQAQELSGGWLDRVIGEELGRAFGARLEQQIWAGTGANQQLKGLTVMTGNSSSTVSGQTVQLVQNKICDQYQQVATNLGSEPDLIAFAPRRFAQFATSIPAPELPGEMQVVDSPAAPLTLGAGTEDWTILLNRGAVPLVRDQDPTVEFHREGPGAGTTLLFRWVIRAYAALGVSRRPEGVGIVKGATPPVFT